MAAEERRGHLEDLQSTVLLGHTGREEAGTV